MYLTHFEETNIIELWDQHFSPSTIIYLSPTIFPTQIKVFSSLAMKHSTKLQIFFLLTILPAFQTKTQALDDPYDLLHVRKNPDGSLTRLKEFYPTVGPNSSSVAISKDVPLNPKKGTWVRVYLPKKPDLSNLAIVVYAHGGGFVVMSTATPKFDTFLSDMASQLAVLVVSVEYRLAPEHRLPAAFDDTLEVFNWIKEKKDVWVQKYGDVTKCILMGESAGGNIAYNVGLRATYKVHEFKPLVIHGLVLIQPFFGQVKRTGSEIRVPDSAGLPLAMTDLMWNLSLPLGANRDHLYCNVDIHGGSRSLETIKKLGWRVIITGCDGDRLYDKQVAVYKFMKRRGVKITSDFTQGGYHGVFIGEPDKIQKLLELVRSVFHPILG